MNPTVLWAGGILAAALGLAWLARRLLDAASRRLEQLLAEALTAADLDSEYRQLLEEDA